MTTATIEVSTADGPMAIFEATPEAEPRGAVIVIQEAFGVNDHIEDVARRLAGEGYHAVAPALFHRAGGGVAPYDDFTKVMPLFDGVNDEAVLMDVDATIEHLHEAGFADSSIGIVGFCFGGRVTFLTASRRALGAGVGFYGGGITEANVLSPTALIEEASQVKTPWLGLFGDLDEMIPVDGVEKLRTELEAAPVPTDVVRYADAGHGFHCDARDSYHPESAQDGWQRALAWFDTHLS